MRLKRGADLVADEPGYPQGIVSLFGGDVRGVAGVTGLHTVGRQRRCFTKRFGESGILFCRKAEELLEIVGLGKLDLPLGQAGFEELLGGLLAVEGDGPGSPPPPGIKRSATARSASALASQS